MIRKKLDNFANRIGKAFYGVVHKEKAQNLIPKTAVQDALNCHVLSGDTLTRASCDAKTGDTASYSFKNRLDGKTFEMSTDITSGGKNFKSALRCTLKENGDYAVESLTLDNVPQKLIARAEIMQALHYLGNYYVRAIDCERVPTPARMNNGIGNRARRAKARFLS